MKKNIVCFGDSNTHGYDAITGKRFDCNTRFPRLLEHYLGNEYIVHEEGLSGRTTVIDDPLFEGLSGLNTIFPILMTHEPIDLLIIMLGTNDTKQRFNLTPTNISQGLERLIIKAKHTTDAFRNSSPNILVIAPPHIGDSYINTCVGDKMGAGCSLKSKLLGSLYKQTAAITQCHFIDAQAIEGIQMNSVDYMHLTKESHDILAKHLVDLIPNLI